MTESKPLDDRVVVHLDVDCFYAQAEILRRPWLQDRPVGVTQKFLVVTCNYVARRLGVPKMVSIEEAKRRCPDLVLINGEDLTPYRSASKSIMAVLKRFGTLERKGLDECAVDVTEEVYRRFQTGAEAEVFAGYVVGCDYSNLTLQDKLLMLGTQVASEMRCAVEIETGFQCSCGVAHNKMLAKLACSLNKPNKQTCMPESAALNFLAALPVRKIPGVGTQTETVLNELGARTVGDLRQLTLQQLSSKFGDRIGLLLFEACRGRDNAPVQDKGFSKSLSVEDSFKPCTSSEQAKEKMTLLAPDLIARLDEDRQETARRPKTFTVKWRSQGVWNFTSVSTQMPMELLSNTVPLERRIEILVETGMGLLWRSLQGRAFCVLNIGATNFVESAQQASPSADIRTFMRSPSKSVLRDAPRRVLGKREVRLLGEGIQQTKVGAAHKQPAPCQSPSSSEEQQEYSERVDIINAGDEELLSIVRCDKCGEELVGDAVGKQQHMDYHMALELQLEEDRHGQQQSNRTGSKRLKRNATLDSFLVKR